MAEILKMIAEIMANIGLGSASVGGLHQPEDPDGWRK